MTQQLVPAPVFNPADTETYNGWTMRRAGNSYYVFDSDGFFVYAHRMVGSRINLQDARATINKSLDLIAAQDMRPDPETNKQTASNNRFLNNCKKLYNPTKYKAIAERLNLVSPRSAYEMVMSECNSLAAGKAILYWLWHFDSRGVDINDFNRRYLDCLQHPAIVRNSQDAPAPEGWVHDNDKPQVMSYNGYQIMQLRIGLDHYVVMSPDGEQLNESSLPKSRALKLADEHNNARLMAEIRATKTAPEPKPDPAGDSYFEYPESLAVLTPREMAMLIVDLQTKLDETERALNEMSVRKSALKQFADHVIDNPALLPSEKTDYKERARKLAARPGAIE